MTRVFITEPDGTITFLSTCKFCGKPSTVRNIPADAYKRWKEGGEFIQNALSMLSVGDRETLLSGLHSECFDKEYPEE